MADRLPDGWTALNHRHLVALQRARHASRRPPQRAIDHLAEYKRIGLSHVVIDFGRDVAGEPSALASPICYAAEIDPTHFGEDKE
jgi:hypothetical protein